MTFVQHCPRDTRVFVYKDIKWHHQVAKFLFFVMIRPSGLDGLFWLIALKVAFCYVPGTQDAKTSCCEAVVTSGL